MDLLLLTGQDFFISQLQEFSLLWVRENMCISKDARQRESKREASMFFP
jgi:hypothetical protein